MSLKQKQADQTRTEILEAAFSEIHAQGFRSTSLGNILKKTNVSKGALYHHFPNKNALGYAVLEEVIQPFAYERWMWEEFANPDNNPIDVMLAVAKRLTNETTQEMIELGCPVCNLIHEMSPVDAGFQERLSKMRNAWRSHITAAIERGQAKGQVVKDVEPTAVAVFLMASHDGASSIGKSTQELSMYQYCVSQLTRYIEGLRVKH